MKNKLLLISIVSLSSFFVSYSVHQFNESIQKAHELIDKIFVHMIHESFEQGYTSKYDRKRMREAIEDSAPLTHRYASRQSMAQLLRYRAMEYYNN